MKKKGSRPLPGKRMIVLQTSQKSIGLLCAVLAALFFSAMTAFVHLAGDLPSMQKALFRNLPALALTAVLLKRRGIPYAVDRPNWGNMAGRCIAGTTGLICNYYAIDRLVLADANMLNKLSPFFAILFSYFLLKEKIRPAQAAGVLAAFCGALLIIKPSLDFSAFFPAFMGVIGGLGAGLAYTFVRRMGKTGEPGLRIVFYFSLFSCLVTFPFFLIAGKHMASWQFWCLMAAGVCGAGGQFSITRAYIYAPARELSVYEYTQILFAALWGFFLFGQVPDWMSLLGYIIIIGSAVVMFFYNNQLGPFRPKKAAE